MLLFLFDLIFYNDLKSSTSQMCSHDFRNYG